MKTKIFTMALLLITAAALTVSAAAHSPEQEAAIQANVSAMIEDYAVSVARPNSANEAFADFTIHAFYMGGKDMTVKKSDYFAASYFNAELTKDAFTRAISAAICSMQDYGTDHMYVSSYIGWYDHYDHYECVAYLSDTRDYSTRLNCIANAREIYGDKYYTGPQNEHDEMMHLLAGTTKGGFVLRRSKATEDTVTYTIELQLTDNFDFNSSYDSIKNKGYNTSRDETLRKIGLLLNIFGLDNFKWYYNDTLTVTVPNTCDHTSENYRWTYTAESGTLASSSGEDFSQNTPTRHDFTSSTTGNTLHYFELEDPVFLNHDQPWVLEFDQLGFQNLYLQAADVNSISVPALSFVWNRAAWISFYEYIRLQEDDDVPTAQRETYNFHLAGIDFNEQFKVSYSQTYTVSLENVPDGQGGNMIYLSVWNKTLGEQVFGPAPLTTLWFRVKSEPEKTLISENSDMVSGADLVINYVGNKYNSFGQKELDLRIYPHGKETKNAVSAMQTTVSPATCSQDGAEITRCMDCGYTTTISIPATGHSYDGASDDTCDFCGEVRQLPYPEGDVNCDGMVNIMDMAAFRADFGKMGSEIANARCDVNGDGMVNIMDMAAFRRNFGIGIV